MNEVLIKYKSPTEKGKDRKEKIRNGLKTAGTITGIALIFLFVPFGGFAFSCFGMHKARKAVASRFNYKGEIAEIKVLETKDTNNS